MKKLIKASAFAIALTAAFAFTTPNETTATTTSTEFVAPQASIKLLNDTGKAVRIHTGSGIVKLNKGGSTSFTCKPGKKVHTAKSGKKVKFLFKVTSSMCGNTVRLSEFM